jgi:hypothetical protein
LTTHQPGDTFLVNEKGRLKFPFAAERLNGQRYVQNWLENLLISGSMNGLR